MDLNIPRYTRETESDKRILCICKPCGVEVKLSKSWLPTVRHITESTHDIVWYRGEFANIIFYWSPTWTKTSEFGKSIEKKTDAKSESGLVEGFPSMSNSPGRDPYTVFTVLFSSHVLLAVITLFLQTLAFCHVNDVKIHTSEQQLKDLGSHF